MTGGVVVRPVRSGRDLEKFIAFPYALHRGDPYWVPPLRMDVRTMLSKKKNPFFQHAEADYLLAVADNGRIVGRIAAIHNHAHNQFHDDTVGFFGFFECANDQQTANALFDETARWLKRRGLTVMRGPASFSTNDECGILVHGFDSPPTLLNPHNPPYYMQLVDSAGFRKVKDLYQFQTVSPHLPDRLIRAAQLIMERKGITLRTLDMKRFVAEVERIKQVYNSAWEDNWGFIPMTDAEVDHLAKQLKPVVVPELIVFAERGDELVGFAAVLPDLNVALQTNPSGRLFPGIFKILWTARKITRFRILLLGLLPQYRKTGADALMYHHIWDTGYKKGYRWAEAGWILEDNTAMNNALVRMGFEHYKTLRMYDRQL